MKDGFVLFYSKDDKLLPVAWKNEQYNIFLLMLKAIPTPITIIENMPQGTVIDLIKEIDKRDSKTSEEP